MTEKRADMMPLWTDAYLADTQDLDAIQHGMYFLLLMRAWRSGEARLKNDERALSNIAKVSLAQWRKHSPAVMQYWTLEGDHWTQKRLQKQWREHADFKRAQSERGKTSAQERKNSQKWIAKKVNENNETDPTNAVAVAVADLDTSKSKPNSSSFKSVCQSEQTMTTTDLSFENLWDSFQHGDGPRSSQVNALTEWARLSPDDQRLALSRARDPSSNPRGLFCWTWLAERHFAQPAKPDAPAKPDRPDDPAHARIYDYFDSVEALAIWSCWLSPEHVTLDGSTVHPVSGTLRAILPHNHSLRTALTELGLTLGPVKPKTANQSEREAA